MAPAASVAAVKLSRDPEFVPKLRDIVGLYIDRPGARDGAQRRRGVANPALDRTSRACP